MNYRLLVLLLPLLLITNTIFAEEFDYSRKDFQSIVNMLDMEGHGNDDLATCNVKQLYYDEVAEMMDKGMNKDEVLAYYVDQMGEEALKAPLKKGFSLTAWVTPFIILILAATLVFYIIKRFVKIRSNQPKTTADQTTTMDETENEILLSMIEEERKKYF